MKCPKCNSDLLETKYIYKCLFCEIPFDKKKIEIDEFVRDEFKDDYDNKFIRLGKLDLYLIFYNNEFSLEDWSSPNEIECNNESISYELAKLLVKELK